MNITPRMLSFFLALSLIIDPMGLASEATTKKTNPIKLQPSIPISTLKSNQVISKGQQPFQVQSFFSKEKAIINFFKSDNPQPNADAVNLYIERKIASATVSQPFTLYDLTYQVYRTDPSTGEIFNHHYQQRIAQMANDNQYTFQPKSNVLFKPVFNRGVVPSYNEKKAQIARQTGIPFENIISVKYDLLKNPQLTNPNSQVYQVTFFYKENGQRKTGSEKVIRERWDKKTGEWRYKTDLAIKALRASLLKTMDEALKSVQDEIDKLTGILSGFNPETQLDPVRNELNTQKENLLSTVKELRMVKDSPESFSKLSLDLQTQINDFLNRSDLKEQALSQTIDAYLSALKENLKLPASTDPQGRLFGRIQKELEAANAYFSLLSAHKGKIKNAKTKQELDALAVLPSQSALVYNPPNAESLDPQPKTATAIEEGKRLLNEAKNPVYELVQSLLKKVDEALKPLEETEIYQMQAALRWVERSIDSKVVSQIRSVLLNTKEDFHAVLKELQDLKDNTELFLRLPLEVQSLIKTFVDPDRLIREQLDEATLNKRIEDYLSAWRASQKLLTAGPTRGSAVAQFEADYEAFMEFKNALSNYRAQVAKATTREGLEQLKSQFPVRSRVVVNLPVIPDWPEASLDLFGFISNELLKKWEVGDAEGLLELAEDLLDPLTSDPIRYVEQIADQLQKGLDVTEDGILTTLDPRKISRAVRNYDKYKQRHGDGAFSEMAQNLFGTLDKRGALGAMVRDLRKYLTSTDPGWKQGFQFGFWDTLEWNHLSPLMLQHYISFVSIETLKMAMETGNGKLLGTLARFAKDKNQPELFSGIRLFLEKGMKPVSGEPEDHFLKRREMALKFWDTFRIFLDYSEGRGSLGFFSGSHLHYLDQIYTLISQPVYQKFWPAILKLDVIRFSTSVLGKGYGGELNILILNPVAIVAAIFHEDAHVDAQNRFGIYMYPPGFDTVSNEGKPGDFLYGKNLKPPSEEWAAVVEEYFMDSENLLKGSLSRAVDPQGSKILLEKVLFILDTCFPIDSSRLVTFKTDDAGQMIEGSLSIQRNTQGKISQLVFGGKTYNLTWHSETGRLLSVS